MKYVSLLLGARRNPEVNNERDNKNIFYKYFEMEKNETGRHPFHLNYFISFTQINKIGINPKSNFDTPLGIYTYPVKTIEPYFRDNKIPFASEQPFIQVLKKKDDKKFITHQYNKADWDKDIKKIQAIFEKNKETIISRYDKIKSSYTILNKDISIKTFNDFISLIEVCAYNHMTLRLDHNEYLFLIWDATYILSLCLKSNHASIWNKILRSLGYSGAIDTGIGYIHQHEPIQAVFFTKDAFTHIDTISNKKTESDNIQTVYQYPDGRKWVKMDSDNLNLGISKRLDKYERYNKFSQSTYNLFDNRDKLILTISGNSVYVPNKYDIVDEEYYPLIEDYYNKIAKDKPENNVYPDMVFINNKIYNIENIPDNTTLTNLNLFKMCRLPNNLTITNKLEFNFHSKYDSIYLGDNLTVKNAYFYGASNHIRYLPENMKVESLYISEYEDNSIPKSFICTKEIRMLDSHNVEIMSKNIKSLVLQYCSHIKLPKELENVTKMVSSEFVEFV